VNQAQVEQNDAPPAIDNVLSELAEQTDTPIVWWVSLIGPAAITMLLLLMVGLVQGWSVAGNYVTAAATAFFVLGRFIILLGGDEPDPEKFAFLKDLNARHLFWMLTWLDMMVAIFVAFHMAFLFKLPWAGSKLQELVSDGRFILAKQPWIRRAAFSGLVMFVIFPTSTTGSIGGTIFGRLLGMTRLRVLSAIFIGSILGNGVMLFGAKFVQKYLPADRLDLKIGGVLAIIAALFFFERKIKSLKQKYLDEQAAADLVDVDATDQGKK
jgi:uncharacterized membrane protein